MFALEETTISKVHQAMHAGEITCAELVRRYLARIEAFDAKLNAVIAVNPEAIREAEALDMAFAEGGLTGPLHGIPVLLKDNCETADMPTTAGSKSLEGFCSERDAFLVCCLRQAGAVIIAKTNLHEFAIWGETVSSMLGQTLNPYDLTRTPGGSSGGTGAALAANFGLVGIGTDTVNSIRSPASACCLCGIRPTVGLVSGRGVIPYALTQDTAGPMARTVEDAVRVLDVIAQFDPDDGAMCEDFSRPVSYMDYLEKDGLRGKRLGVLYRFFGKAEVNRPVDAVMDTALAAMEAAGATLVPIEEPIDSAWLVNEVSVHLHELKTHFGAYLSSFGDKAPVCSIDEILESGMHTPGIAENLRRANRLDLTMPEYSLRLRRRAEIQRKVIGILEEKRLDALIYPHQQQLVCKVGDSQKERNGALASVTGFPAIVVSAGFTVPDETAPIGVPVGLEMLGRPLDEAGLIALAYGFEQKTMVRRAPIRSAL